MHTRTEDLLSVRDGEPVDAAARARVLADADCAAEIERLEGMRRALKDLPELAPPPGAWEAIAARVERLPSRPRRRFARLFAGGAIAATVAVGAVLIVAREPATFEAVTFPPAPLVGVDPVTRPLARQPIQVSPISLEQESVRLERMLAQLPRRSVMSASTASTIAGLEDRITFIDDQLTLGTARGLLPEQKQLLWRERVDLMNALVHVRYAQADNGGF